MSTTMAAEAAGGSQSVPRAARGVREDWCALATPSAGTGRFEPGSLTALPPPARRWLAHAVPAGTPLWRSVEMHMRGHIRLGAWRAFTATQVLSPPDGFIWAATARFLGLPVVGFDRYSRGAGEMRWRLLGVLPVMSASGSDVTRSAAGRLAGESVFVPTAYHRATWTMAAPDIAVATWRHETGEESAELRIGPGGELLEVRMQRWGNPNGAAFGRYPFGVSIEREHTFSGITIPAVLRAGWWWGTERQAEGEFFRATITKATFR